MSDLIKIVSSQYKHLPGRGDDVIAPRVISHATALKNEPLSFQVLYRSGPKAHMCTPVSIAAHATLPMEAFRVDYIPVMNPYAKQGTPGVESHLPGLFPDLLMSRPAVPELCDLVISEKNICLQEKGVDNLLNATPLDYQAVWFTVNPESRPLTAGKYEIRIAMTELKTGDILAEDTLHLEILDAALPPQTAYYTNWFHVDCVCDLFGVKPYSNAFYKIFDQYIANMTRHRQNLLLLPAFTPPLDTPLGAERMNVQLVEIEKTQNGWQFGFEKMRRFVRHAKKNGIRFFEHSHLFSQWGAKHAPNIYDKNGTRLFGVETDAAGEEYRTFIRAYLTAFFRFAESESIRDRMVFHISDEPSLEDLECYRLAHDTVADLLCDSPVADAMFHAEFFEQGLVNNPIAMVKYADRFEGKCDRFWLYYTGGEGGGPYTNRLLSNTAARTRVLGLHMYRYNAPGFLQWAYNYYYDFRSTGCYDPKITANGYRMYPGVSYLCYPILAKGGRCVAPSIREKLMGEAMDDLRALRLLESMIGREATLAMCEKAFGPIDYSTIPEGEQLREFRETVNRAIMGEILADNS